MSSTEVTAEEFIPEEDTCFGIWFDLYIGPPESQGIDNFRIFICTPEWLCKNQWLPLLMRHVLLVRRYDTKKILKTINEYIDSCEGENWSIIGEKLSRVFEWEFEDFVEFSE